MSGWVRSQMAFASHAACIVIRRRDEGFKRLADAYQESDVAGTAAALEAAAREMLLEARPELSGCSLVFMEYDLHTQCFKLLVDHPSFRGLNIGELTPEIPLHPGDGE